MAEITENDLSEWLVDAMWVQHTEKPAMVGEIEWEMAAVALNQFDPPPSPRCRHEEIKRMLILVSTLVEALYTDGAHHKQWYIEEALKQLNVPLDVVRYLSGSGGWQKGIAP